ncbi:hypothetical protein, partial [Paenibacillus marchantiophytorum]|uniref:hypothetical protein n=1 Tax=Paenibacillus marchantiophytorum TaxID=1619310 RepID=UPI001E3A8520
VHFNWLTSLIWNKSLFSIFIHIPLCQRRKYPTKFWVDLSSYYPNGIAIRGALLCLLTLFFDVTIPTLASDATLTLNFSLIPTELPEALQNI